MSELLNIKQRQSLFPCTFSYDTKNKLKEGMLEIYYFVQVSQKLNLSGL